jgi:RNA polymerase primary sigma factor
MNERLIDVTDPAVRRMIRLAKKRGYVTSEELNRFIPPEKVSLQQMVDVFGQLSEVGITVVQAAPKPPK